MKHIIDTDELEKLPRLFEYPNWVIRLDDLRTLIANSPQADGYGQDFDLEYTCKRIRRLLNALGMSDPSDGKDCVLMGMLFTLLGTVCSKLEKPRADGMVLENYESLPKLGGGIYKHEKLGELYDRLQVQQYAVKYCDVISSLLSAYKPQADDKDNCEVCKGAKGGVKGNENIVNGKVMCDYCHAEQSQADDVRKDAWISVKDRLPLWDGVSISYLTVTNDAWYRICEFNGTKFPSQVTHWQPLPAPPLDKARE